MGGNRGRNHWSEVAYCGLSDRIVKSEPMILDKN
jgi:hypothetical protein